ncbi:MAG: hypothetical protein BZ138_05130 [Methanosphaera sp. rholeuAM270]|nr:MAG: hypothetical protein BZ138_05130 [Methanosphaera sp. rholeuAM270]
MSMKCNCKQKCIKTRKETLAEITNLYDACPQCNTKTLKKAMPLQRQVKLEKINENYGKCSKCRKRHIDMVMAHVLKIMIENKQIAASASIRKVGTPLITPAIPLEHLPYLSKESLVIITTACDQVTAQRIMGEVPEIKAIIKGNTDETVGILDENSEINNYELLGGCDIRCDIQYTDTEAILIYKQQSKIHIEYPKQESPKIMEVSRALEKYESPTVLDAMCGPGTLGIYALLKNASKVVFNDINRESINTLKTNLKINGINEETYEIYNENILDLTEKIGRKFNMGIIDAFPGVDSSSYREALEKICDEVIII